MKNAQHVSRLGTGLSDDKRAQARNYTQRSKCSCSGQTDRLGNDSCVLIRHECARFASIRRVSIRAHARRVHLHLGLLAANQ